MNDDGSNKKYPKIRRVSLHSDKYPDFKSFVIHGDKYEDPRRIIRRKFK